MSMGEEENSFGGAYEVMSDDEGAGVQTPTLRGTAQLLSAVQSPLMIESYWNWTSPGFKIK